MYGILEELEELKKEAMAQPWWAATAIVVLLVVLGIALPW